VRRDLRDHKVCRDYKGRLDRSARRGHKGPLAQLAGRDRKDCKAHRALPALQVSQ